MIKRTVFIAFFAVQLSTAFGQKADLVSLSQLQALIASPTKSVQVVNFWATWCAPCIKELPLFEKLNGERSDITVTLVSMDMDLDSNPDKVYKFMTRKNIQSRVVILNERNPNSWIDKIDKNWSGALPATLIVNPANGKRKFIERAMKEGDLEKYIKEVE